MAESLRGDVYTLELAEEHVANANGNIDRLGEALTQDDTDLTPNTPATGNIQYSASGQQKYVSADGNAYNTGRQTLTAANQLALSTTLTTVPGLSATFAAGTYRLSGVLMMTVPTTAGQGALKFKATSSGGLTAANGRVGFAEVFATNGVGLADFNVIDTTFTGSTPGTGGANRIILIEGVLVVTVAGSLAIQASQNATAAATIVQYGTYLDVCPVS